MVGDTYNRPTTIGRFTVEGELGRGMMGVVYRATDPVLHRQVALKTIRLASLLSEQSQAAYERRFLTEARVAARLQHPGIVVVHDLGRDEKTGILFIALELLTGETLAEWIAEGRRPAWRETLRIVARLANALHHAHSQGVVHRDVKPANVMILANGEPKIMDFGIAKVEAGNLTNPGELFGTPLYMAPEQALGEPADARSDLFSLGTIAYTLLTGVMPFRAGDVPTILARVAHVEPPRPTEVATDLPGEVDYIVARAMAKDPGRRYATGRALAEDIEDVLAGRSPRHRGSWSMPERAEKTIAPSASAPRPEQARVAPEPEPKEGAKGQPGRRAELLAALACVLLGAGLWVEPQTPDFWIRTIEGLSGRRAAVPAAFQPAPRERRPLVNPAITEAALKPTDVPRDSQATPDSATAESTGGAASPESEASPVANAITPVGAAPSFVGSDGAPATTPTATPPPTPEPMASPTPPQARTERAPSSPAGALRIELQHDLKGGTLAVWLDGRSVLTQRLGSRPARASVRVRPGARQIRVAVRWPGNVASARTKATFEANGSRTLEARLGHGILSLGWK